MGTAKRERQKLNRQQRLEELAVQARKKKTRRFGLRVGIGLPLLVLVLVGVAYLTTRGDDDEATGTPTTSAAATTTTAPIVPIAAPTPCPSADGSTPPARAFEAAPPQCIDPAKSYSAVVETNKGTFTIELNNAGAPINTNNFVTLARYHYYDNSTCHRIITDFVVQCGRPGDETAEGLPSYTVGDELAADGSYAEGIVAMANTGQPDTGGGQFFVITGAQGVALPNKYTVLGKVTEGYDTTVKALEALADPAATNGVPPLEPISIVKVTITETDAAPVEVAPTSTSTPVAGSTTTTVAASSTTAG